MIHPLAIGAALVGLQVSAPAPVPEIKGARITLAPKTAPALTVTIENRRSSPIIEARIGVTRPRQSAPSETFAHYFHAPLPGGPPDNAPIEPNTRRVLDLVLRNGTNIETVALTLVAFADGSAEGAPRELGEWRKARRERVEDLDYWVRAFEAMPRISEPDARAFLAERLLERGRQAANDPSTVRSRLQRVLDEYAFGPQIWMPLDRLRADVRRELAALPPEPPSRADGPDAAGSIAGVVLSWERSSAKEFVAVIENLRDVPIEAYGLQLVDPVTARPRSAHRSDFCLSEREPIERGRGRIQPRETREVFLGSKPGDAILRLSFVLFDDLSFEGSPAERDDLLQEREARGADYAYAIDVIAKASALPPAEARAFAAAKRAERAGLARTGFHTADVSPLDEYIRQLTESPERAAANAKPFSEFLERQRQRLVRHAAR
jgi:hypothetical protein